MTVEQRLFAAVAQLALLACLVGLVRSGRWRMVYGFTTYLVLILTLGPLQTWWPATFNNWTYWSLKQTAYDGAKIALAIELAARVCRHFPGARAATARWLLAVLLLTAAGLAWHPWSSDATLDLVSEVHARAVIGTLWLLAATAAAIWHYRLVVHPFLMGLIVGFASYLAIFGGMLRLLNVKGWAAYDVLARLDQPAYLIFALGLAWIAWRRDGPAAESYLEVVASIRTRVPA